MNGLEWFYLTHIGSKVTMPERRLERTRQAYQTDEDKLPTTTNDWPDPQCRCCECQGKMCFTFHNGHSHRTSHYADINYEEDIAQMVKDALADKPRKVKK